MEQGKKDLIIVGSGPAGLSAAVYAKRAGLDLLVLEKNPLSGGQVLNTYEVDNYLGMPGIGGFEMGMQFRQHADRLGVAFEEAFVSEIRRVKDSFYIEAEGKSYEAATVIIATGAHHAKLNVPGEEELAGMGVSYCATCDGAFFKGKTVAVVGGGDVALEDAIYLSRLCEKVYLIHRRGEFRGAKILQEQVKSLSNIEILYHHTVEKITGEDMVEKIILNNSEKDEKISIDVSGVFIAVGIHPEPELLQNLIDLDPSGYVVAPESTITGLPGLFVAGDIRKKPIRQIVTAVADGANAAVSAEKYCEELRSIKKF